jgi:1,2-diacylglycerol 3-beta-galactosyltransferase
VLAGCGSIRAAVSIRTMPAPRILILSSRTGGGHSRVAQILGDHLRALEPSSQILQADGLVQTDLGWRVDPAQSFLTLTTTLLPLYNLCYRLTNTDRTVEAIRWLIRRAYGRSLARVICEHKPDLIVSTHHFLSPGTVARPGLRLPPFVMVVSDLGQPHRLWFDPRLDTLYVPTADMVSYAQRCMARALRLPRVETLGFPINAQFAGRAGTRSNQLLVMGGGAGSGPMDRIVRSLSRELPRHRVVVVCGHNDALRDEIASWEVPNVEVHGFVNNVPELMTASDIVITKAGPVTIMEAVDIGRPLIITSWVGMQERDNVEFVIRNGLGLYCREPRNLPQAVRQVYDRYADFSAAKPVDVDHGPDQIAAGILEIWRRSVVGTTA